MAHWANKAYSFSW